MQLYVQSKRINYFPFIHQSWKVFLCRIMSMYNIRTVQSLNLIKTYPKNILYRVCLYNNRSVFIPASCSGMTKRLHTGVFWATMKDIIETLHDDNLHWAKLYKLLFSWQWITCLSLGVKNGYMSLGPGFIASWVHCVPGSLRPRFYVFATFMQLCCNFYATVFVQFLLQKSCSKVAKKNLPNSCIKNCNFWGKKVAKRVATNLQKVAQKSCIKVANTYNPGLNEPRTQWTRDAMNPGHRHASVKNQFSLSLHND